MIYTHITALRQILLALGGSPEASDTERILWAKAARELGLATPPNFHVWHLIRAISMHYGGPSEGSEVVLLRGIIDALGGLWSAAETRSLLIETISEIV